MIKAQRDRDHRVERASDTGSVWRVWQESESGKRTSATKFSGLISASLRSHNVSRWSELEHRSVTRSYPSIALNLAPVATGAGEGNSPMYLGGVLTPAKVLDAFPLAVIHNGMSYSPEPFTVNGKSYANLSARCSVSLDLLPSTGATVSAQSLDKNLVELPDGTQGYWILSGTVGAGLTAAARNCLLVAALQIAETVASPIALAEAEWKQAQHDWKRAREAEERAAEARRDAREILDSAQENLYRIKARRAEQGPL